MIVNDRALRAGLFVGLIIALCIGSIFSGCATLTPAQKTLWGLNVYQAQYGMYLDMVIDPALSEETKQQLSGDISLIRPEHINPNLTESQKKILRIKKEILIEMKPLVLMAAEYQVTGNLPPDDVQRKLTELINRLVALVED